MMCLLAGCGTTEYENRLNTQGVAAAKKGETLAVFTQLFGADKIYPGDANSPMIRLPMLVQNQYAKGAADSEFGNQPIAANEWGPPNMVLPAQKVCWRGYKLTSQSQNFPLYVYLGQQKAGTSPTLVDAVNAQLAKAFPGKPVTWTDESFLAEDGVTQVPWKRVHMTGDMAFGTPPMGETTVPGTLDILVHNSNGWEVLVGLRLPDDLEKDVKLTSILAPAICGSIQVPAPAAAP